MSQGFTREQLLALVSAVLNTKGDLLAHDGAALGRLGVGSDGAKLIAEAAQSLGVKWQGYSACRVYKGTNQSIGNNSETAVTFDNEQFDTDDYHSLAANTDRLTVSKAGLYIIGGVVEMAANATGVRYSRLFRNGATNLDVAAWPSATATINCYLTQAAIDVAAVNDYYTITAWQNSGGNLNVVGGAFWIARIF